MIPRIFLAALALTASPALAQWSTATLSEPRSRSAATSIGDIAYFGGGSRSNQSVPSDAVDAYDARTGLWSTATLSAPRTSLAATSVAGFAFFAGGTLTSGMATDIVDVLDTRTGTWSTASLSTARTRLGAVTVGRFAIFAGGGPDDLSLVGTDVVDVYDGATGAWSSASLPIPLGYVQAASIGDRAVFYADDQTSELVLFDPSTGTSALIPRPAGFAFAILPTLSGAPGRVLLAGGILPGSHQQVPLDALFEYDIAQGAWSTTTMAQARGAAGVARTSAKLVVAGGLIGAVFLTGTDAVELFDLTDGSRTTATLSRARVWPSTVEVGGKLILAGGLEQTPGGALVASAAVDIFDDRVGASYCSPAALNSTGEFAEIRVEGVPGAVAQGHVVLVAARLPASSAGYFLASRTQGSLPGAGGSQGTLCLGGSIGRYSMTPFVTPFGGRTELAIDLTAVPSPTGAVSVMPGETWNFQAWYRDTNPTATTNFTSAIAVVFQ